MVVDSSALVAIALAEPEGPRFRELILESRTRLASAISRLETSIVVRSRKGGPALRALDSLLDELEILVVDFSAADVALALDAWSRYGKGNHPAALNLGDCCTYALARNADEPVLFKGVDFSRTDLEVVRW
jgi:ribonuclease VapC